MIRKLIVLVLWLSPCHLVTVSPCLPNARAFDPIIDSAMYRDPDLPMPRTVWLPPEGMQTLWQKALERPEIEMRCKAAEAAAQAQQRGVQGLEKMVPGLRAALDLPDQHPIVRLAAAKALIALEARDAAPSLLKQAQTGGNDLRDLVEPALARWDYRPARAVWLERLADPAASPRGLVLAIRGLGAVREGQAAERLRTLVLSGQTSSVIRLESGHALGLLRSDGLEKDAEHLAADVSSRGTAARLAAAALLRRHQSEKAVQLLQRLTLDPEPAVAALAAARLLEIDSKHLLPVLDHLLASPDAKLRAQGVDVLLRHPSEKHVHLLGDRLDDVDPEVRAKARKSLEGLAAEFRTQVIAEATRMLATRQWRGLEQATILAAQVDYKPATGRLVELLRFNRPEVCITAAWGLRRLAVPETLPAVLNYVEEERERLMIWHHRGELSNELLDHQISQLNQFLGKLKYKPAEEVLQKFIPHVGPPGGPAVYSGTEARAAAIWALGWIHEGKAPPALAAKLEERLNDISSRPPEEVRVRLMAGISLGRIKATQALPSLRRSFPEGKLSQNPVNNACGWAVEQLTGEVMPRPQTIEKIQHVWFLEPFEVKTGGEEIKFTLPPLPPLPGKR